LINIGLNIAFLKEETLNIDGTQLFLDGTLEKTCLVSIIMYIFHYDFERLYRCIKPMVSGQYSVGC
jgi:hypothetical protein